MENFEAMRDYLQHNLADGKQWITFMDFELSKPPTRSDCFHSARDADEYCENHIAHVGVNDDNGSIFWRYDAISNLLIDLNCKQTGEVKAVCDPANVLKHMEDTGLLVELMEQQTRNILQAAAGKIIPVSKPVSIIPAEHICRYAIIEHTHQPQGNIFELGHTCRVVTSLPDYRDIMKLYMEMVRELPERQIRKSRDLILVAQFDETSLKIDGRGFPEFNTGITISHASWQNGRLKCREICDPKLSMTFMKGFFIRMNENSNRLICLDDTLTEFSTSHSVQSYSGLHFSPNPLDFSRSTNLIMPPDLTYEKIKTGNVQQLPDAELKVVKFGAARQKIKLNWGQNTFKKGSKK